MEITDGLELSPRKVDYLKFIFEYGETVKTNDIASQFNVDPSTITKTIAEIAEAGYLTHVPYRGVFLTEAGTLYAKFLIKRHRILSLILVRNGLPNEQACNEVSRFESFVSKDAIDRMCSAHARVRGLVHQRHSRPGPRPAALPGREHDRVRE